MQASKQIIQGTSSLDWRLHVSPTCRIQQIRSSLTGGVVLHQVAILVGVPFRLGLSLKTVEICVPFYLGTVDQSIVIALSR